MYNLNFVLVGFPDKMVGHALTTKTVGKGSI